MILSIYSLLLSLLFPVIWLASRFSRKLRLGIEGRKNLLDRTREHYETSKPSGTRILIHVASYGELEQAKPVIAALKEKIPSAHVHLTFFSPSGYENVIGKYSDADFISYAPFDLRSHVSAFLEIAKPDVALFTRYDVWPNMAAELSRRKVPSFLFAATASETSGRSLPIIRSIYRNVFRSLTKILTISDEDKIRFGEFRVNPETIIVTGDTRFDQVIARRNRLEQTGEHLLPERIRESIEHNRTLVFIVGSSWESDEAIYLETLKNSIERKDNILTVIAPHESSEDRVRKLLAKFAGNSIRFSKVSEWNGEPVIIVDSIGKLFGLYRYADIAMIGGGFGAGLHNILEVAIWGTPAIVGPKHNKSREVQDLVDRIAAFVVTTKKEFDFVFWRLAQSEDLRQSSGVGASRFVEEHRDATSKIMDEIMSLRGEMEWR